MKNTYIKPNNTIRNAVKLLCLAAAVAIWLVAVIVYGASVTNTLIVAAFFVFYVQLPGLLLTEISGIRFDHLSTNLIVSAFTGWSYITLVYFISDIIPTDFLLYISGPLLSVIYLYRLFVRRNRGELTFRFDPDRIPVSFCIFAAIALLYCFCSVQYRYLAPEIDQLISMNPDKAYHIGLISSLSHDYPIVSPWANGIIIHYHVFSELLMSVPVRLFGVPADFVSLSFNPIWTTYIFSLSTYAFFRELSTSGERAGIYSLLILLSNIYITRNPYASLAFKFALTNDNSSGYGIASVFVFIIMFKKWYELFEAKSQYRWSALIMLTAFIMLATGIKGPMAAVVIAGVWGTLLLGMILRKVPVRVFIPLGVITAGFLFVYLTVLSGKGTTNSSGASLFALAKIADIAFWKKPLIAAMKALGLPSPLRLAAVLLVFMIFFFTVYFVPFCAGYIRELFLVLTGRKDFKPERVLVYAACLVGFVLLMVMNYSGHSQVYFGLVTVFLAPIVAYWFIEDLEAAQVTSASAKRALKATLCIMAVTLVVTMASFTGAMARSINASIGSSDPSAGDNKWNSITNEEYQALVWLRNNTSRDSLVASDRYYSVSPKKYHIDNRWDNRFFLYEIYSNRFSYISGSGYSISDTNYELRRDMIKANMALYDPANADRGDQARELGIDYVIVSKRFTDVGDLSNQDLTSCFENDDIIIYEVAE